MSDVTLRTLREYDKFYLDDETEYRKTPAFRTKDKGTTNIQNVTTKERSFIPPDTLVRPKSTSWEHRRNVVDRNRK